MHTRETLAAGLGRLGVAPGDTLFVHSSFKSLGPVDGGAPAVIGALEDSLGPDGLLLMPSFNLLPKGHEARAEAWNRASTPSSVGWLTECFRSLPGSVRSDHFSHSVAARGKDAAAFVGDHRSLEGYESPWDRSPWGRAFGTQSPMLKAFRRPAGKVLMLGVDYHSSTYCHVVETLFWAWKKSTRYDYPYQFMNREEAGLFWDGLGRQARGRVGDADCRLFPIRAFVETLLEAAKAEPKRYFKYYLE
jgi:aminoglycoside 3-N-acetyltransferase